MPSCLENDATHSELESLHTVIDQSKLNNYSTGVIMPYNSRLCPVDKY